MLDEIIQRMINGERKDWGKGIEKKIFMLLVINTAGILVNFLRCY